MLKRLIQQTPMMKTKSDLISTWLIKQEGWTLLTYQGSLYSVVDVVLATSLQFTGSTTVFGIEVLKQDQYIICNQYSWTGCFFTFFGHFSFFKPTEILQFAIMNCSRITCVVKLE